jgi:hypothetical protein
VATAFGGVNGGVGESGLKFDGVNSALNGFGVGGNQGDGSPAAHLNYILFDQQYRVMDAGWAVVPPSALNSQQKISIPTVNVKEAGTFLCILAMPTRVIIMCSSMI